MEKSEEISYGRIIRYLDGSVSEAEMNELLNWLNASEDNQRLFIEIRDLWESAGINRESDIETESALLNLRKQFKSGNNEYSNKFKKLNLHGIFRAAAAVALIVGTTLAFNIFYYKVKSEGPQAYTKTIIPKGQKGSLILADGTEVWLNSGTTFRYASDFGRTGRDVYLEGEAYFDVTHKAGKPFMVHTGNLVVKVLGTSFNVKSYPEDKRVETTLIKGSVKLYFEKNRKRKLVATLEPNQQASFDIQNRRMQVVDLKYEKNEDEAVKNGQRKQEKVNGLLVPVKPHIESIVQWKDQKLSFENETLAEMVIKLERWYGKAIVVLDEDLMKDRYSGKFEYNENIYQVLDAICRSSYNLEYYEKDHKIYVQSK